MSQLDFQSVLQRYFAVYDSTLELASELIAKNKHPIEVLILLCARLDALASDAASDKLSSRQAFTKFVISYGGQRSFLTAISVADLHYELAYHRWLLEVTIPAPGRLEMFSDLDRPLIHLLEDAGQPLTLEYSQLLLDTLIRLLKREFRVAPGQRLSKPRFVSSGMLAQLITERAKQTRLKKVADRLPAALAPLLETKRISSLLYQRFRCESIHGGTIILDEKRFFDEESVYWKPLVSPYYGAFELIEFPASYLISLLKQCITTYRSALIAKGKMPPSVHFHAFSDDIIQSLDWLDRDLLPEGGSVRLRIER